jgi:hypothetical protein
MVEVVGRGAAARTAGLIALADSLARRRLHLGEIDPADMRVAKIVTGRGEGLLFCVRGSALRRAPWSIRRRIGSPRLLRIWSGVRRPS